MTPRTTLIRCSDVLRVQLEALAMLAAAATAGPWDARGSWVITTQVPVSDIDSADYYGGELVAESMQKSDAVFVAAARNVLPGLAIAHIEALDEIDRLKRDLRYAILTRLEQSDKLDFSDFLRQLGYRVNITPLTVGRAA
jgi:hypothetical protein